MSNSSTEARDTAATTATALSLDSKTDSNKIKLDSKTKSDSNSKEKVASKVKSDSGSKTEGTTDNKEESEIRFESKNTSKSDSVNKVASVAKIATKSASRSQSKTAIQSTSKEGVQLEPVNVQPESVNVQPESVDVQPAKSVNEQPEPSNVLLEPVKVQPESTVKMESAGRDSESPIKTESSKRVLELKQRTRTDSTSKPESLINRLDSGSQVESGNNVKTIEAHRSGSKSKTQESTGQQERMSSTDSGQDLESANNPASPVKTQEKTSQETANGKSNEQSKEPSKDTSGQPTESPSSESGKSPLKKKNKGDNQTENSVVLPDELNPTILPTRNNPLYNTTNILENLDKHPLLKMRRDGKYYLKVKDVVVEEHPRVKRNKRGDVIPTIKKELMGAVERVVSRFAEDVLCISRAQFLPLSSQGERHLVWVGKKKANHIIRYLNGNGCYVVNRFPGDIFMKDKQVMGIILRDHMLMRSNHCYWKCGVPKEDILNPKKPNEDEEENPITFRICRHMVKAMKMDEEGCEDKGCFNFEKHTCKHLDVFIPEVQSFCTYNALQDFSNRLEDDLKGQIFVCKPAYLFKGYGFRFFRSSAEFQEFYHMTEGKETSRHDFMVQRLVDRPFLFNGKKVDIRAFLLVVVLRYRRVISFIHYGFCRVATAEFELKEDDEESKLVEEVVSDKEIAKKKAEEYEQNMQMFVCTYRTAEEKSDRAKRMEAKSFTEEADDRSQEITTVFPEAEELQKIKEQIRHIGIQLSHAIENKVWEAFGCFQIFGLDLCVDEDMKVWLIEVNSHAMSDVDTLSPTQRKVVPAVIMEALGLVVETTYKSFHHMRLRKSPTNEFEETGFIFRQNYDFIFSTLAKKRVDYVWPKPPRKPDLPFYTRIAQVDEQIKSVEKRKKACQAMKIAVREEQLTLKRKRMAKDEEES